MSVSGSYADLPRFSELVKEIEVQGADNPWPDTWQNLQSEPEAKRTFDEYEHYFGCLDDVSWKQFKQRLLPYFANSDSRRGWTQAFDFVNEAVAFAILKKLTYSDLRFIPVIPNRQTPDISASRGGRPVVCEVKTINKSDDQIDAETNGSSFTISNVMSPLLLVKLGKIIAEAEQQLSGYENHCRLVFVVLNFDDYLHEYVPQYFKQIHGWLDERLCSLADTYVFWARRPFTQIAEPNYYLLQWQASSQASKSIG